MAYARLLLPDLLPEVSRLLYVDSDLLVKRSVAPIWEMDMGDKLVAATSCSEIQTLEKGSLPVNELELNPDAPYLQSGFMLMDLDGWRVSGFSEQCLEYLTRFPEHAPHWDQSAINGMIGSRWKRLDPMWNVSVMDFEKLNGGEVDEVNVLHYSGPYKPWKFGTHRWGCSKYFYDLLDRTEWSGWRPSYVRHLLRTAKFRLWKCLGIR
jgi:lipopolysaccharide biosynthesis glycosyltransferase